MQAVQTLIVAVIVVAALISATWRLSPAKLRMRVLDLFKTLEHRPGYVGSKLRDLRQATLAQLTFGCHACSANRKPAAPRR